MDLNDIVFEKPFWSENNNFVPQSNVKLFLIKQANELGRITKNIVEANIETSLLVDEEANGFTSAPKFTHCFEILAPFLGYQKVTLFCITQIVGIEFPLTI